jgi:hypothetical protein
MLAMAHAALTAIEIPESQLRAAWARLHRDTWPATFEGAMADAVLSRLVRLHALHPAAATPPQAQPEPRHHTRPAIRPYTSPPPGFVDHKRAAAGDRDDD